MACSQCDSCCLELPDYTLYVLFARVDLTLISLMRPDTLPLRARSEVFEDNENIVEISIYITSHLKRCVIATVTGLTDVVG